jgi:cytidylate kinase
VAIITISRGSYSKGKAIAENVAERLGYECLSRDILLEASEHFHIPEVKLVRALHDAPSVLNRFTYGKEKYVAFIREAFLRHVQKDNVVYHGLAGQFFLEGVPHTLKVRVIADFEDRVRLEMERESIGEHEARRILKKDDDERHRWALALYGIDTTDPSLYDLVIHVRKITVDDAVDMICHSAKLAHFETTEESQRILDDLVVAARVKSAIVEKWPRVDVSAEGGVVVVHAKASLMQEAKVTQEITAIVEPIDFVKEVRVSVSPVGPYGR